MLFSAWDTLFLIRLLDLLFSNSNITQFQFIFLIVMLYVPKNIFSHALGQALAPIYLPILPPPPILRPIILIPQPPESPPSVLQQLSWSLNTCLFLKPVYTGYLKLKK